MVGTSNLIRFLKSTVIDWDYTRSVTGYSSYNLFSGVVGMTLGVELGAGGGIPKKSGLEKTMNIILICDYFHGYSLVI